MKYTPASTKVSVAIVGAGYAGLAAAVSLVDAGHDVTLFETSRTLGGRARKVAFDDLIVDNGQHILIGAYRETLALMRHVGVDEAKALLHLPLTLSYPTFKLNAPKLPAPLHVAAALLTARGLTWRDKYSALRFMQWLKRRQFQLETDTTLTALLDQHAQPETLRRFLWAPLCISALNTPADAASAQVFAHVLRDSLAADRAASDLLIPRTDLSALLAEPAAHYVAAHGGKIHTGHAVSSITRHGTRYCIDDDTTHYDHVVLAVAPHHLLRLIETLPALDRLGAVVNAFSYEPIVTCYLRYPPETKLPQVMTGFTDAHAHWVFDRGQIDGNDGLISAVISAEGKHRELDRETLAYTIDAELRTYYPWLPRPLSHLVITEKRATFACTPNLQRPTTRTDLPGVWLAGDYVTSDYPATIEGAVRSGLNAATAIITAASIQQAT